MKNNDKNIIKAIKEFAESELENIARADEEYQRDSLNYIYGFSRGLESREIELNIRSIVQDFRVSIYGRYLRLIVYCEKLLQMGE